MRNYSRQKHYIYMEYTNMYKIDVESRNHESLYKIDVKELPSIFFMISPIVGKGSAILHFCLKL